MEADRRSVASYDKTSWQGAVVQRDGGSSLVAEATSSPATAANADGYTAETRADNTNLTPKTLPPFIRAEYDQLSPDGLEHFPIVFEKLAAVWRAEPNHELADLARLAAPTLLMLGDHDVLTVEHAAAMQQTIPDARLAVLPGASHALLFEKADLANRLLLAFLTEP
jgi:pimeloyl-ACP methyl ester carboxylesterase